MGLMTVHTLMMNHHSHVVITSLDRCKVEAPYFGRFFISDYAFIISCEIIGKEKPLVFPGLAILATQTERISVAESQILAYVIHRPKLGIIIRNTVPLPYNTVTAPGIEKYSMWSPSKREMGPLKSFHYQDWFSEHKLFSFSIPVWKFLVDSYVFVVVVVVVIVVAVIAVCSDDELQCLDGTCRPSRYKCDGYFDCQNGEDELHCRKIQYSYDYP